MVILGATGRNFAAGMSGGLAYIYDPETQFPDRCNAAMVGLEPLDTDDEVRVASLISEHVKYTQSPVGQAILDNWTNTKKSFIKVLPHDFKAVLAQRRLQPPPPDRSLSVATYLSSSSAAA